MYPVQPCFITAVTNQINPKPLIKGTTEAQRIALSGRAFCVFGDLK